MARVGFDANQNWLVAYVASLQLGRKLEGVCRHYPVVVVGGGDHSGGVLHTGLQVVQRRIGLQVIEILRIIR